MKNKFVCIFILAVIISSCSKNVYDINYLGEDNYSNFYVVDTIRIVDPVRIHSLKYGGQFIVSKKTLKEYNGKDEFFYRPDVFFIGNDFYRDLPTKDFKNISIPITGVVI